MYIYVRTISLLNLILFFSCSLASAISKSPELTNGETASAGAGKVTELESGTEANNETIYINRPPEMLDKDYFGRMIVITNSPPPHKLGPGQGGAEYIHYLIDNIFYGVKDIKWNWGVREVVQAAPKGGGVVWIGRINNAMVYSNESGETVIKWTCQYTKMKTASPKGLRERPIKLERYEDDYFVLTLRTPEQSTEILKKEVDNMVEQHWHVLVAGYPHSLIIDGDRTLVNLIGVNEVFMEKMPVILE